MSFIDHITEGLDALLGWIGMFLGNLLMAPAEGSTTATLYVLLPLVAIGASFTIVKFGIHIVRSFAFGF